MKKGQIALNVHQSLENNREFLRRLYSTGELDGADRFFTRSKGTQVGRAGDSTMTPNAYATLMSDSFHVRLQLGSPSPGEIRYLVKGDDLEGVTRVAQVECPLTDGNYQIVGRLYEDVFGESLDEAERL